jgi:hypothetical protein
VSVSQSVPIGGMNTSDHSPMSNAVNPVMNQALYAEANRAALAVFAKLARIDPEQRAKAMEKAARAIFRKAGTPADASALYACAITCDIFERVRNEG